LTGSDGADHRRIRLDVGRDGRDEEQRRVVLGEHRADRLLQLVGEAFGRAILGDRFEDGVDALVAQADITDLTAHLLLNLLEVDRASVEHEDAIAAELFERSPDRLSQHAHPQDGLLACRLGVIRHREEKAHVQRHRLALRADDAAVVLTVLVVVGVILDKLLLDGEAATLEEHQLVAPVGEPALVADVDLAGLVDLAVESGRREDHSNHVGRDRTRFRSKCRTAETNRKRCDGDESEFTHSHGGVLRLLCLADPA